MNERASPAPGVRVASTESAALDRRIDGGEAPTALTAPAGGGAVSRRIEGDLPATGGEEWTGERERERGSDDTPARSGATAGD
jgi:hypothetical protein